MLRSQVQELKIDACDSWHAFEDVFRSAVYSNERKTRMSVESRGMENVYPVLEQESAVLSGGICEERHHGRFGLHAQCSS